MIRTGLAPVARAASTNSRSFNESTCPRVRRATPIQFTTAIARNMRRRPPTIWPTAVSRSDVMMMMRKSRSGKA